MATSTCDVGNVIDIVVKVKTTIEEASKLLSQKEKLELEVKSHSEDKKQIQNLLHDALNLLQELEIKIGSSVKSRRDDPQSLGPQIEISDLLLSPWDLLGDGKFGTVYKAKYKGTTVAVKVVSPEKAKLIDDTREATILSNLSHDNIVAFRGKGVVTSSLTEHNLEMGSQLIVMEYILDTLYKYVLKQETPEKKGLSLSLTWSLGKQIANALHYLHTLTTPLVHGDLKPDNILLDTGSLSMVVKLADFGLAYHSYHLQDSAVEEHVRWAAPELVPLEEEGEDFFSSDEESDEIKSKEPGPSDYHKVTPSIKDRMRGDMLSYGYILDFMISGEKPWASISTLSMINFHPIYSGGIYKPYAKEAKQRDGRLNKAEMRKHFMGGNAVGPLKDIIESCLQVNPTKRLTAKQVVEEYFMKFEDRNPYVSEALKVEFFSCGFLKDTKIFVADSMVEEPKGYPKECLLCLSRAVPVNGQEKNLIPEDWSDEEKTTYRTLHQKYLDKAKLKEIDNNVTVPLKKLITERSGDDELQRIELEFSEGKYCHHRTMRDIWRSYPEEKQNQLVPSKSTVHQFFSTSFGLHVAILTNEGVGKTPKFIFPRRSKKQGMASPGAFTCGAVESISIKDYVGNHEDGHIVSLAKTAARGLEEELGIQLSESDLDAICLGTVYVKFDTHEWGMCGFVDLSSTQIIPEHRLSFNQVKERFSSGPKDKFEHEEIYGVDFEIGPMVDFVRENYQYFASSAKLVVVKVMQAFFGVHKVEKAFRAKDKEN